MVTTVVGHPPPPPVDHELTGAADLLGETGVALVAGFLNERGLDSDRVEPAQAHYRPGRWLAVCFRTAAVERSSGRPVCPTVTVERRAGEPDAIWIFPEDPALPGLAAAANPDLVRRHVRPRSANVSIEPVRYRPRRRAVFRYRLDAGDVLYGKVVPPGRGRRLLTLAEAFGGIGLPLALPAGQIGPGALVVPGLPGRSLRDLLMTGGPLPPPARVAGLAADLHRRCALRPGGSAADRSPVRRRVDPGTALGAAEVVTRLLPGAGGAARRVAEAVIAGAEKSEPPPDWIVHGDLYENQVLVAGDSLGLIDLDDLGPGDPLLDAANFSAHLLLLGASTPLRSAGILRYRDELATAFRRMLDADPEALAWREAYCLLRLTPGPFRILHGEWPRRMADRLALAAGVLAAEALAGGSLRRAGPARRR